MCRVYDEVIWVWDFIVTPEMVGFRAALLLLLLLLSTAAQESLGPSVLCERRKSCLLATCLFCDVFFVEKLRTGTSPFRFGHGVSLGPPPARIFVRDFQYLCASIPSDSFV